MDMNKPYTEWLELAVKSLFKADVKGICIACTTAQGHIGTMYWNMDGSDMDAVAGTMHLDAFTDRVANNREFFKRLIEEETDDDDCDGE